MKKTDPAFSLLVIFLLGASSLVAPDATSQAQTYAVAQAPAIMAAPSTSVSQPLQSATTLPVKSSRVKRFFSRLKSMVKRNPPHNPKPRRFALHKPHWLSKFARKKGKTAPVTATSDGMLKAHIEKNVHVSSDEAKLPAGLIKCSDNAHVVIHRGCVVDMQWGDVLVAARRQVMIHTGGTSIVMQRGAIALISNRAGVTKIRNLNESRLQSIRVFLEDTAFPVRAGQEVAIASDFGTLQSSVQIDSVQRRALNTFELPSGRQLMSCEFEPVTMIKHNDLLRSMIHTNDPSEKAAFNSILKMAACLQIATAGHGEYLPMAHDAR